MSGNQHCGLTGRVATNLLGCTTMSILSHPRNWLFQSTWHLHGHIWHTVTTCGPSAGEVEKGPAETSGIIRELEYLIYEERWKGTGLLRLENRRFKGDLITLLEYL